jgi:ribonuclease E
MTNDGKPQDHWLDLATLLGAAIPAETPAAPAASDTAMETCGDTPPCVAESVPTTEEPAVPPPALAESSIRDREPASVKPVAAKPPPPAKTPKAAKRGPDHWRLLAGQLGIELPPEPEPVEAAPAPPEADATAVVPVAEDRALEEREAPAWDTDAREVEEPVMRREPAAAERWPGDAIPAEELLEKPGVLDEFFDAAELEETGDREPPGVADAESERKTERADRLPTDEGGDRAGRRRRRRGRRHRRGGGEEQVASTGDQDEDFREPEFEEAADEEEHVGEDEDDAADEEEAVETDIEPASEGAPARQKRRRRRRRRRPTREGELDSSEAADTMPEPAVVADQPPSEGFDDEDTDIEDEDDDAVAAQLKHHKLPTWEEAIGTVIAGNQEARAKNPGGGQRGRGYRGRK